MIGLVILGIVHQLGGYLVFSGKRLYAHYIIQDVLRFDKIVHCYGIFIITLVAFYLLRPYLKNIGKLSVVSILLVFVGMGIGTIWEFYEFLVDVVVKQTGVGGYMNTMGDLLLNTLGAILAVVYLNRKGHLEISKKK